MDEEKYGVLHSTSKESLESIDLAKSSPSESSHYAKVLARTISEDAPDPRIQVELERLNTSTDTINKLEVELDEARLVFRQLLADSTQRIDMLGKKLGKCVQQARPYYDARIKAKQALQHTQAACLQYERAVSEHTAAREMVYLAEEGLVNTGCTFDQSWQEMLNHASAKVNAAERAKHECGAVHQMVSLEYQDAEARVQTLQQQLKRAIARSSLNTRRSLLQMSNIVRMQQLQLLPYFEAKSQVNQQLEHQKQRVRSLEKQVNQAKDTYASALDALESISDQIHKKRQSALELGVRGVGVGAESPISNLPDGTATATIVAECANQTTSCSSSDFTKTEATNATSAPSTSSNSEQPFTALQKNIVTTACPAVSSATSPPGLTPSTDVTQGYGSEWQLVSSAGVLSAALTVEDASISDSESLASMEMLSDDAIAGLMLDEELIDSVSAAADANTTAGYTPPNLASSSMNACPSEVSTGSSSTNPFNSTNPFYSLSSPPATTSFPYTSSTQNLLSKIDQVISNTADDANEELSSLGSCSKDSQINKSIDDTVLSEKFEQIDIKSSSKQKNVIEDCCKGSLSVHNKVSPACKTEDAEYRESSEITNAICDDFQKLEVVQQSFSEASCSEPFSSPVKAPSSPNRSPQNRPSSLPLNKCNNIIVQEVPELIHAEWQQHPESLTVTDSTEDSVSSSEGEGSNAKASSVTPAYAPLQDALESPLTFPPPNYPPPPPPRSFNDS